VREGGEKGKKTTITIIIKFLKDNFGIETYLN
jgi:hypothetical protein